jgi:hypothetical protein
MRPFCYLCLYQELAKRAPLLVLFITHCAKLPPITTTYFPKSHLKAILQYPLLSEQLPHQNYVHICAFLSDAASLISKQVTCVNHEAPRYAH